MSSGRIIAIAAILAAGLLIGVLILREGQDPERRGASGLGDGPAAAGHADSRDHHGHGDHHDEHDHHAGDGHDGAGRDHHEKRETEPAARHADAAHELPPLERRIEIADEAARRAGIEIEAAGPATLETRLRLNGRIVPNEDRLAHVLPRFAGIVREVRKHVGDAVAKGEVMAVVQSNQSLQPYEVRSELAGTVIEKHVTTGEFAAEGEQLYTVADLDSVWIDLDVYRQDFSRIALGQTVLLDAGEGLPRAKSQVAYISPFGTASTQTMLARVVLANPDRSWRPGFFVTADVTIDRTLAPVAVRATAVQTIEGREVVFVQDRGAYRARPIESGRRDREWVEVLAGLEAGERYVSRGSFVVKAEAGKSGASHDH